MSASLLRDIPAIHELLARPAIQALIAEGGLQLVTECAREAVESARTRILAGGGQEEIDQLVDQVRMQVYRVLQPSLITVINATGVVLHTNLGRAPLSATAAQALAGAAAGYTNLEYDLVSGRRGKRDVHAAALLERLLGASAVVVNNNAAAVFLCLHELAGFGAAHGEVIVSRGELVEIGGSFRVPDIMARSGAVLRETGTTNRTRLSDYANAITERTRLLLRVHQSNFKVVGFTERPALEDLVALARARGIPLMDDLGSGCLMDLTALGLGAEPEVCATLRSGADLVTFSADKLLGGPQAGIIAGRSDLVDRIRRNPLFRALRVDKLTYSALGETLRHWITGRSDLLPVARMLTTPLEEISARAVQLADGLKALPGWTVEIRDGFSLAGGGSTPGESLPTKLVSVTHPACKATALEKSLRRSSPPVVARVEDDRVVLDPRTILPGQEAALVEAFSRIDTASSKKRGQRS